MFGFGGGLVVSFLVFLVSQRNVSLRNEKVTLEIRVFVGSRARELVESTSISRVPTYQVIKRMLEMEKGLL